MAKKKVNKKAPSGASSNSREDFLKFIKSNKGLTRTEAYKQFRAKGGKIRKQTALEIARAYVDVKKNEPSFRGVTLVEAKKQTRKEIKKGERTEIAIPVFKAKRKKPRKNESNIIDLQGNYLSKTEATELRRLQRRLREEQGLKLSLKELAQSGIQQAGKIDEKPLFAYDTRKVLKGIELKGVQTVTIIDRNGKKTTFTGTREQLENNPQFMQKLEDEQQRLFAGAEQVLKEKGLSRERMDKNAEGYLIFQMQLKQTDIGDNITILDYRDIREENSGFGGEAIIEGRKRVRR